MRFTIVTSLFSHATLFLFLKMGIDGNSPKKVNKDKINQETPADNEAKDDEEENMINKIEVGNSKPLNVKKGKFNKSPSTKKQGEYRPNLSGGDKSEHDLKETMIERTEEYLQNFFLESFGRSSSTVFDIVSKFGELHKYENGDVIIKKGVTGRGVFIIMKGRVCVTTSDLSAVIEELKQGDVFGEVSSIYDIASTANVVAMPDTEVVFVPKREFGQMMEEFESVVDIIDWYIYRRYLPTSDLIDTERVYRRTAFSFLRKSGFFSAWPDNALKSLIMSLEHRLVLLYPTNSMIIVEGDPLNNMVLVLKGSFTISHGSTIRATVEISRTSSHFMFGGLGITNEDQSSSVSLKTKSSCQVVLIPKGNVLKVAEDFPALSQDLLERKREHNQFIRSLGRLYRKYEPDIQPEILAHLILKSDFYTSKPESEIRIKVRQGTYQDYETGVKLFLDVERDTFEAFLVISGQVSFSYSGIIGRDHVLSKEGVGVLEDILLGSVEATCPCLILKIPKNIQRSAKELDNLELV